MLQVSKMWILEDVKSFAFNIFRFLKLMPKYIFIFFIYIFNIFRFLNLPYSFVIIPFVCITNKPQHAIRVILCFFFNKICLQNALQISWTSSRKFGFLKLWHRSAPFPKLALTTILLPFCGGNKESSSI